MKKMILGLLLPAVCMLAGSCTKTFYCSDYPQQVAEYFPEENEGVLFSNGSDSVVVTFERSMDVGGFEEFEFSTKAICWRRLGYTIHGFGFGIDVRCEDGGEGAYYHLLSDNLSLGLRIFREGEFSEYEEFSFNMNVASDRMTLEESPWGDTLTLCTNPRAPYDSVRFVRNVGLLSIYDRQDSTTWRRAMP
ncbi:MAG: hypothetical protein MJZ77_04845 [Bacteroidales bacterium]|nr:hypothetical protein [Bacteroidales bacterium]